MLVKNELVELNSGEDVAESTASCIEDHASEHFTLPTLGQYQGWNGLWKSTGLKLIAVEEVVLLQ